MIRRLWTWTRPASIEETLALWAASLREVKHRIRPLFTQERVARNAGLFLESLLGDEQRKTGWMRAEAAGDPGPWRQQAILGRRDWDADGLRDIVRDYVVEHLADDDAVLVIDETGFLKQGKASCGVARQYTGSAGKITNCQIGVFAAYVSRHGHAFIDRALYLPKEWEAAVRSAAFLTHSQLSTIEVAENSRPAFFARRNEPPPKAMPRTGRGRLPVHLRSPGVMVPVQASAEPQPVPRRPCRAAASRRARTQGQEAAAALLPHRECASLRSARWQEAG